LKRLVTIGECMIELQQAEGGLLRPGFAGDMLNSAFYARQILTPEWSVGFFSGFGTDRLSRELRGNIEALGIDTSHAFETSDRQAGLYMIHLTEGERSFSYWRSHSAARLLASNPALLREALSDADIILFSGITLAILENDDAESLFQALAVARDADKVVAFDPNIRIVLWPDRERMVRLIERALEVSSIALPSFDDEALYFGDADPDATIRRILSHGPGMVVVKDGPKDVRIGARSETTTVRVNPASRVVDTTGAGDSFNGVFLARLALNDPPEMAARTAASIASIVIQHHGALVPQLMVQTSTENTMCDMRVEILTTDPETPVQSQAAHHEGRVK